MYGADGTIIVGSILLLFYLIMYYIVFGCFWLCYVLECVCLIKVFLVPLHGD